MDGTEIRLLYYLLPLFFLTLTSGLPPGPVRDLTPHNPLWAKLSYLNQSDSVGGAMGEEEPNSEQEPIFGTLLPLPPTPSPPTGTTTPKSDSLGQVLSEGQGSSSTSASPTPYTNMDPPPIHAPLQANHTNNEPEQYLQPEPSLQQQYYRPPLQREPELDNRSFDLVPRQLPLEPLPTWRPPPAHVSQTSDQLLPPLPEVPPPSTTAWRPHVSQTTDQLRDKDLVQRDFRNELEKQIRERKELDEERRRQIELADAKLERRIEEDRKTLELREREERLVAAEKEREKNMNLERMQELHRNKVEEENKKKERRKWNPAPDDPPRFEGLRDPCNNTTHICVGEFVDCRKGICKCMEGYAPRPDNRDLCGEKIYYNVEIPQTDPTMIGVIIGLILMSVTLCVVLRLFAKARFRENRTIFNTPNPRLMNVSLMKGSKRLFRGGSGNTGVSRSRRGSQTSINSTEIRPTVVENGSDRIPGSSSRPKPTRQMSTDTTAGTPGGSETPTGTRQFNRNKYRQDSVASNSNV